MSEAFECNAKAIQNFSATNNFTVDCVTARRLFESSTKYLIKLMMYEQPRPGPGCSKLTTSLVKVFDKISNINI